MGWSIFGFVLYKVATSTDNTKVYNPFEILNIAMVDIIFPFLPDHVFMSKTGHVSKRHQVTLQEALAEIVSAASCTLHDLRVLIH